MPPPTYIASWDKPVEEDDVAGLQLADRHLREHVVLRHRVVRQGPADLRVGIGNQAGAVESGRRLAAPDVRDADDTARRPRRRRRCRSPTGRLTGRPPLRWPLPREDWRPRLLLGAAARAAANAAAWRRRAAAAACCAAICAAQIGLARGLRPASAGRAARVPWTSAAGRAATCWVAVCWAATSWTRAVLRFGSACPDARDDRRRPRCRCAATRVSVSTTDVMLPVASRTCTAFGVASRRAPAAASPARPLSGLAAPVFVAIAAAFSDDLLAGGLKAPHGAVVVVDRSIAW